MTPLQPLIDAANHGDIITLADGEYDDATPVYVRKDVSLVGSRNAIVHSEFQVLNCNARFSGFTLDMNKEGAPARNGVSNVYPQNGLVVVINASLWADDLEVHCQPGLAGYALVKNAFHVVCGSTLHLRAITQFSRVDWRNSTFQVIEVLYGSYANIFDLSPQNLGMNIVSNASTSPLGQGGAAITVMGSKCTMSGSNVFNYGPNGANAPRSDLYGVSAGRDSYIQVGAGKPTSVQGYGSNAVFLDPTSRKIISPGCWVN